MPRRILQGKVQSLWLGNSPGTLVSTRVSEVNVTIDGLEGDRHARPTMAADGSATGYPDGTPIRNTRQVTIIGSEELREIAVALEIPELGADWLGVNMVLDGVPGVTLLPPATRLYFAAGTGLAVEGENMPCIAPGRVIESHHPERKGIASLFPKAALHRRGLIAWVERPGVIREGDAVRVEFPDPTPYPN